MQKCNRIENSKIVAKIMIKSEYNKRLILMNDAGSVKYTYKKIIRMLHHINF